jgi:uncharacterized protein YeaO (DUF488 family)
VSVKSKRVYDSAERGDGPDTLLYAARDREHNNAVVLEVLVRG